MFSNQSTVQLSGNGVNQVCFLPVQRFADSIDLGAPDGFEVFIGRMPLGVTKKDVFALARRYKPLEVRMRPRRRYSYLCAFVSFSTLEDANNFIEDHHGESSLGGESPLSVRFSDGRNGCKKVFFGGLDAATTDAELAQFVSNCGTVVYVNIVENKSGSPCGFVTFATADQAKRCIKMYNGVLNGSGSKIYSVSSIDDCDEGAVGYGKRSVSGNSSDTSCSSHGKRQRFYALDDSRGNQRNVNQVADNQKGNGTNQMDVADTGVQNMFNQGMQNGLNQSFVPNVQNFIPQQAPNMFYDPTCQAFPMQQQMMQPNMSQCAFGTFPDIFQQQFAMQNAMMQPMQQTMVPVGMDMFGQPMFGQAMAGMAMQVPFQGNC